MADLMNLEHRHNTTLNRVPDIDALKRREIAIAHRNDAVKGNVNAAVGVYIRTGSAASNNANDKVVRVGAAIVTDNGNRPDQLVTNGANVDWLGASWLDKSVTPHILYMNINGLTTGWRAVASLAA
jgi:hypothetical protein